MSELKQQLHHTSQKCVKDARTQASQLCALRIRRGQILVAPLRRQRLPSYDCVALASCVQACVAVTPFGWAPPWDMRSAIHFFTNMIQGDLLWNELPLCRAPQSPPRILAQDRSAGYGAISRGGLPAAYEGDPVIYIILYGLNGVEKAPL